MDRVTRDAVNRESPRFREIRASPKHSRGYLKSSLQWRLGSVQMCFRTISIWKWWWWEEQTYWAARRGENKNIENLSKHKLMCTSFPLNSGSIWRHRSDGGGATSSEGGVWLWGQQRHVWQGATLEQTLRKNNYFKACQSWRVITVITVGKCWLIAWKNQ